MLKVVNSQQPKDHQLDAQLISRYRPEAMNTENDKYKETNDTAKRVVGRIRAEDGREQKAFLALAREEEQQSKAKQQQAKDGEQQAKVKQQQAKDEEQHAKLKK
jgi:hypothetical protein